MIGKILAFVLVVAISAGALFLIIDNLNVRFDENGRPTWKEPATPTAITGIGVAICILVAGSIAILAMGGKGG